MQNPALPHCLDLRLPFSASDFWGKAEQKNFSAKIRCNPLISLVSHERIQGNPRKPKRHKRGFSRRKGHRPRKSKSACRVSGQLRAPGPEPAPSTRSGFNSRRERSSQTSRDRRRRSSASSAADERAPRAPSRHWHEAPAGAAARPHARTRPAPTCVTKTRRPQRPSSFGSG